MPTARRHKKCSTAATDPAHAHPDTYSTEVLMHGEVCAAPSAPPQSSSLPPSPLPPTNKKTRREGAWHARPSSQANKYLIPLVGSLVREGHAGAATLFQSSLKFIAYIISVVANPNLHDTGSPDGLFIALQHTDAFDAAAYVHALDAMCRRKIKQPYGLNAVLGALERRKCQYTSPSAKQLCKFLRIVCPFATDTGATGTRMPRFTQTTAPERASTSADVLLQMAKFAIGRDPAELGERAHAAAKASPGSAKPCFVLTRHRASKLGLLVVCVGATPTHALVLVDETDPHEPGTDGAIAARHKLVCRMWQRTLHTLCVSPTASCA